MNEQIKFKDTEIGLIPVEWKEHTFEDFIKVQHGFAFKSKDFSDKGMPVIKIKNITPPKINLNVTLFYDKPITEKLKKYVIEKGDVIISLTGSNVNQMASAVGKVAIYKEDKVSLLNQRAAKISIQNESIADLDYIYLYISREDIQYYLALNAKGSANQANISEETIHSIPIYLPTVNEQKEISKIICDIDGKIELNQQMNKTLEAIAQAIFKHWFVDFEFPNEEGRPYKSSGGEMVDSELGGIPKGWEVSKIGTKLKVILGGTPDRTKKEYWNGNINWINSGKVNEFRITEPSEKITKEGLEKSATKLLPKGTVVLAITGATLGQVSRLEIDSCANQSVIGILENDDLPSEYLLFWIKKTIADIIRWQTGGAQQHINKGNVEISYILIPPSKIINEYLRIARSLFNKISINCFLSQNLSKIRDSLLPKLMSGKIRVPVEVE